MEILLQWIVVTILQLQTWDLHFLNFHKIKWKQLCLDIFHVAICNSATSVENNCQTHNGSPPTQKHLLSSDLL